LGSFFHQKYESLAGVIAMAAVFLLVIVEMVFTRGQRCCGSVVLEPTPSERKIPQLMNGNTQPDGTATNNAATISQDTLPEKTPALVSRPGNSKSTARVLQRLSSEEERANQSSESEASSRRKEAGVNEKALTSETSLESFLMIRTVEIRKKALLQCLLLEMSILFHSIFIGMAVSVAMGRELVVLLVAICFHRTFPTFNCCPA
jgi:hypothetical protein